MPPYGKNMRSCCDSLNERGARHMRGCPNENVSASKYFVSTHAGERPVLLAEGFYNWLTQNKFEIGPWRPVSDVADLGDIATIHSCDGMEQGTVLLVDHTEQKA